MKAKTDYLLTRIDISKLPSLPQTLIELIDLCNSKDQDLRKIGRLVARDATISARTLQLANSAFIGARNRFSDIEQAVIYLGTDTIRNLAISVSVHETFSTVNTAGILNISSFWYHSLLTAVLAKTFSQACNYSDPAEAYLTGLLHDIGKLLLFTAFPERYPALLEQECNGNMLPLFEKGSLGVNHAEASSLLVSQWNLNETVSAAIFRHHDSIEEAAGLDDLGKIIYAANRLSNALVLTPETIDASAEDLLGMDAIVLPKLIEEAKETVDRITLEMGIKAEAGPLATVEPSKRVQANRTKLVRKVQAVSMIGGVVDNLLKADNLQRIVRILEESFQLLFNIRYCLLLLPDVENRTWRIHVSAGNQNHGHEELSIPVTLSPTGMIRQCLEKRQILHASTADGTAIDSLEAHCLKLLDAEGLVAIPIPLEAEAQGILVAGVGEGESATVLDQRETLGLLAGQVGMRIRLERLQHRAAVEQMQALTRVARQIAHEIETPIARVQRVLPGVLADSRDNPDLQQKIIAISREIEAIWTLSAQLNDLSSAPVSAQDEDVDLNEMVADVVGHYRHMLGSKSDISFVKDLDTTLPPLRTNLQGIRLITEHLLKNGIEALPHGGTLSVKTSLTRPRGDTQRHLTITVDDDGPGAPPELADAMFTAGVTTKGAGHIGLGLTITRKLVQELGGTISYASGKMAGSRFTVSLPVKSNRMEGRTILLLKR